MNESFSITPRIIGHFGEDLIKNESIALLELVKNSYDACATKCTIDFQTNSVGKLESLSITDDGFGMNENIIKTVWLVIGTDFKHKNLEPNCCGRFPLGEKGIGRLGVHKLGNKITLVSKSNKIDETTKQTSKEVILKIDWTKLDSAQKINDFVVEVSTNEISQYFTENGTGTKIIIEGLKTKWDRRQIREVYRNLTSLNSPFSGVNDSFNVKITSNSDLFSGLPTFDDIRESGLYFGHCVLNNDTIEDFKYEFKPWTSLNKIDGRIVTINDLREEDLYIKGFREIIDEKGKTKKKKEDYDINLSESQIGKIEFDIIIYETDAQIFNMVNSEKTSIKSYLKENGGVRVYRDDVRVYDYGEPANDWLGIDLKRVHRVGGNVSNNIILGSVKLNRAESFGLKEKTNREGFIENESYSVFVDAVDYALSLIVRERNVDKVRLTTLYKKYKVVEPVLSDLNDVIEIVERKIVEPEIKKEIRKYLDRISEQYKEVKEVLIKSANAGLNLSVVIHEIEKQVAALVGHAQRGEKDDVIAISLNLEKIVRGYTAMIRKSEVKATTLSSVVKTALDNYEFRFSDHKIETVSNWQNNSLKAFLAEAESTSVLTNLLDNAVFWLSYTRKENRKISVYITDQISGFHSIIVSDNGPGFNIPADVAVQPFITGKPHNIGMGLGLHIADEMMRAMKGQLLFLDKKEVVLPKIIRENEIDKAIIALCFPKEKK
ncbi:MAG: ATP-binding protein [Prevotellaceae bacterium]|jgi:signal transduction histidine kinase|nr:ATP-binding protein [Prevotellaceae bacterium]